MENKKPFHVLNSQQFDRKYLDHLFELTDTIRKYDKTKDGCLYLKTLLAHRRAMLYFTQPSTRTFLSFQTACYVLGIQPCEIRDPSTSSERKGESIEDSFRTFSSYVDLIIMRSPISGLCDRMAKMIDESDRPIPIINGGSGPDQHPTQGLLDIYTLYRAFRKQGGEFKNKTICMVGDVKRGRTVRSLSRLLTNFENIRVLFVSPAEYRIEDDLRQDLLKCKNISFEETSQFEPAIAASDAIYMTRVQDEYDIDSGDSAKIDSSKFHLRTEHLKMLKKDSVILHPMPRRKELDPEVDKDPRALYWRQERNGLWMRAALITKLMEVDHHIVMPAL
jgi:aspartate carbamoyltransferase catalytic subunit